MSLRSFNQTLTVTGTIVAVDPSKPSFSVEARRRLNIGFVAYSPLGRGFLSGAIRSRSDLNLETGGWKIRDLRRKQSPGTASCADLVAEVAKEIEATPAQVALAWLLSRDVNRDTRDAEN